MDGVVQVRSSYDKDYDHDGGTGPFANMTEKFDTMLYRFNVGGWVNFVSFSLSSNNFAFGSK